MPFTRPTIGCLDKDALAALFATFEPQDLWAASDPLKGAMAGDFVGAEANKLLTDLDTLTSILLNLRDRFEQWHPGLTTGSETRMAA